MMTDLANRMFADALVPPSTGEWERYLQQPLCDRTKENSLQWWKKKESEFPRLSKVARVLLCAMPTSAPCESLFSIVGRIQDYRRCSLSPPILRELVLLNRWLKLNIT
jgi:hypothetical protein